MLLLLKTGILQVKNYLFHNKVTLALTIFATIAVLAYVILLSFLPIQDFQAGNGALALFPCAFVVSVFIMLLSFAQADNMMISESEANIFFISPIPEHKVLIYIFIKSSFMVVIVLLAWLQANMNIIRPMFMLNGFQNIRLIIWEALCLSTCVIAGIFLTLVKKKNPYVFYGILLLSVGVAAAFTANFIYGAFYTEGLTAYFNDYFSSPYLVLVPVAGVLAKASSFIISVTPENLIYIAIALLTNVIFIMSPYYIKVAMGEMAVEAAVKFKKRRERKRAQSVSGFKIEKQIKDSEEIKGSGAFAIISKQWLEYKRSSRFLLSGSILLLAFIMAVYLVVLKLTEYSIVSMDPAAKEEEMRLVMMILNITMVSIAGIMAIVTSNPISKDVKNPIIYLMPEKAWHKVAAISFMPNFEAFIKSILIFGYLYLTDSIGAGLSICISLIFFFCLSSAIYIDMFFNSVLGKYEIGIFLGLFSSGVKLLIAIIYIGMYISICFISSQDNYGFISIPALIITGLMAAVFNLGSIILSDGLIEDKD